MMKFDFDQIREKQKEAGILLGRTTNAIKDVQRASKAEREVHRLSMEAGLPKSDDGWNDVPSMLESFKKEGIFDGPVNPATWQHTKYLKLLDLTRRAAEARQWYWSPAALLLRLLEEAEKMMAAHAKMEAYGLPPSDKEKRDLSTAVQGFKQQLGLDLIYLARDLRTRGYGAVCADLPLLGSCTAKQIAMAAERFSNESWELLKAGATTLPAAAVEAAAGACKKNIANAREEQEEPDQGLIQGLRLSAKNSYIKGGVNSTATYHEIGAEMPTQCTDDCQVDAPLATEGEEAQDEQRCEYEGDLGGPRIAVSLPQLGSVCELEGDLDDSSSSTDEDFILVDTVDIVDDCNVLETNKTDDVSQQMSIPAEDVVDTTKKDEEKDGEIQSQVVGRRSSMFSKGSNKSCHSRQEEVVAPVSAMEGQGSVFFRARSANNLLLDIVKGEDIELSSVERYQFAMDTSPYNTVLAKAEKNETPEEQRVAGEMQKALKITSAIRDGKIASDDEMHKLASEVLKLKKREDIYYTPQEDKPGVMIRQGSEKLASQWGFTIKHDMVKSPIDSEENKFDFIAFSPEFESIVRVWINNFDAATSRKFVENIIMDPKVAKYVAGLKQREVIGQDAKTDQLKEDEITAVKHEIGNMKWEWHTQKIIVGAIGASETECGVYIRTTALFRTLGMFEHIETMVFYEDPENADDSLHFKHHIMQPHITTTEGSYKINEDYLGTKRGWSLNISSGNTEKMKFGFRQAADVAFMSEVYGAGFTAEGALFATLHAPIPGGPNKNIIASFEPVPPKKFLDTAIAHQVSVNPSFIEEEQKTWYPMAWEKVKTAFFRPAHFRF